MSRLAYVVIFTGIVIDHETPDPAGVPESVYDDYDNIKLEVLGFLAKWTDPNVPPQESYPVPILEYDGKK